jgi:uncharacterized DUF497 family protein
MPRSAFDVQFEWDPRKAQTNRVKHDVSFELAATVFGDRHQVTIHDGRHDAEDRWITLGQDRNGKLLVVIHTWDERPGEGARVRIISARPATIRERKQYENLDET